MLEEMANNQQATETALVQNSSKKFVQSPVMTTGYGKIRNKILEIYFAFLINVTNM